MTAVSYLCSRLLTLVNIEPSDLIKLLCSFVLLNNQKIHLFSIKILNVRQREKS